MILKVEDIKTEIENSLDLLSEQKGDEIAKRIRLILYINLDRGRIQSFVEGDISLVRGYIWRVAEKYINLSPLINKLQIERTTLVWEPLYKQMVSWAYNFFLKKGFHGTIHTQEKASECATEAAMNILRAYFPYDTDLEPWACVVVQNTCRKYIRKATKKSTIPQQNLVDLEDMLSNIKDPSHQDQEYIKDLQSDLLEAINQLLDARQQVVKLIYFDELPPVEIANRMNKSVGAIYNLQFNALHDLRKILSKKGNNINE
jgi:RNA polymerase sigma factor (sigma-70 family)